MIIFRCRECDRRYGYYPYACPHCGYVEFTEENRPLRPGEQVRVKEGGVIMKPPVVGGASGGY